MSVGAPAEHHRNPSHRESRNPYRMARQRGRIELQATTGIRLAHRGRVSGAPLESKHQQSRNPYRRTNQPGVPCEYRTAVTPAHRLRSIRCGGVTPWPRVVWAVVPCSGWWVVSSGASWSPSGGPSPHPACGHLLPDAGRRIDLLGVGPRAALLRRSALGYNI